MTRRAAIAAGLASVEQRVLAACAAAGRQRDELTLIVVTKFFPAAEVRILVELGVRDVGENRDQEAAAKVAECRDLDLRWHFIGQLQSNKAASVAGYAACVHSVDRPRLVEALATVADPAKPLKCLIQVGMQGSGIGDVPEDGTRGPASPRGGATPADVPALAALIAAAPALTLGGVMTVAPIGAQPRAAFDRLVRISAELRGEHPGATIVSAGMSGDLEAAIAAGATHLRVGSAVLGSRPPNR